MSYRVCSQAVAIVLHTIIAARGVTGLVGDQNWNLVRYTAVTDPLHSAYLNTCFTVIKSLLKFQASVDVKLQIMDDDAVLEEWLIAVSMDAARDQGYQEELQAVLDQIQASPSFLPDIPASATYRIFVTVTSDLNMPSQCTEMSVPPNIEGSGQRTQFRQAQGMAIECTGYQ